MNRLNFKSQSLLNYYSGSNVLKSLTFMGTLFSRHFSLGQQRINSGDVEKFLAYSATQCQQKTQLQLMNL